MSEKNTVSTSYDDLKTAFETFNRQHPDMTYYGNIPASYSENTTSWIQWMHFMEGIIIQINNDTVNMNNDFNDLVTAYNSFILSYNQQYKDVNDKIDSEVGNETQSRINADDALKNDLQAQINLFNRNAGFNFGRQKTLENKFDSSIDDAGGETPDYYASQINGSVFSAIPSDNFNVGFITDNHFQYGDYAPNSDKHYMYAGSIARKVGLDAVIAGGDNINGDQSRTNKYNQLVNVTETLINRVPNSTDVFFLLGNHDTGIGQSAQKNGNSLLVSDNIDEKTIKKLYKTDSNYYDEIRDGDSLYGYKDYQEHKIRLVFLNAFDLPFTSTNGVYDYNFLQQSGFQNKQLNWLANTAFKLPDNTWQVMIFSHAPISGSFGNDAQGNGIKQFNTDALIGIINAMQNGSTFNINDQNRQLPVSINADFTGQGIVKLIAFVSGHVHEDGQMIFNGINAIETICSWSNTNINPMRLKNTETEDAQDVFSIDRNNSKIFIYRFGFGINREFTY